MLCQVAPWLWVCHGYCVKAVSWVAPLWPSGPHKRGLFRTVYLGTEYIGYSTVNT